MRKVKFAKVGLVVASLMSSTAHAQQIEEILVTAQKRSENLQDVPIAISAVTSEALDKAAIREAGDLTVSVPGLSATRVTQSTIFYLRGVGTAQGGAGIDSTIATFVDGVYLPSMASSTLSLNNIARVEVLKGPQGTLYGRNATGGAINIVTRDPGQERVLEASIGYGNKETVDTNVYTAMPLTSTMAIDFAASYHNQGEGFGTNLRTGTDINKSKDYTLRSKLVWTPSDVDKITLSGDYSRSEGSTGISFRPTPESTLLNGQIGYTGGYYDTNLNGDPYYYAKQMGGMFRYDRELGDFSLTSISAYRYQKSFQSIDVDGSPLNFFLGLLTADDKQFTQEVQLNYVADRFKFILGGFYLSGSNRYKPFLLDGLAADPFEQIAINSRQRTESLAVFAQGTYEIFPDTNLTLGARYTRDVRRLDATQFGIVGNSATQLGPEITDRAVFKKPTWRIALDHNFSPDLMAYASYSRGFKSGVYNLSAPADPVVKPETLDAYELGFKSSLFDRHLRFNAAVFYYDYKNIQLNLVRDTSSLLLNAASSKIYGLDVDFEAAVTDNLSFQGGMQLIHARYRDFPSAPFTTPNPNPPFGNNTVGDDASGNRMVVTPDASINFAANYSVPVGSGAVDANVATSYNSGYYWAPDNRIKQPRFLLVNARLGWTTEDEHFNVHLWARNLTDKKYLLTYQENTTGDIATPALGRTFGVSFGFKY